VVLDVSDCYYCHMWDIRILDRMGVGMIEKLTPTHPEEFEMARANRNASPQIFLEHLDIISMLFGIFGVRFYLGFGTLLGAVRDRDYIRGDADQDLIVLERDEDRLIEMLQYPYFSNSGLHLARCHGKWLISLTKDNQYTDIYIFRPDRDNYRCCDYTIEKWRLDRPETINFKGHEFLIPAQPESYLERIYGDWRTPAIAHAKEC